jgi:hypothetical protein
VAGRFSGVGGFGHRQIPFWFGGHDHRGLHGTANKAVIVRGELREL